MVAAVGDSKLCEACEKGVVAVIALVPNNIPPATKTALDAEISKLVCTGGNATCSTLVEAVMAGVYADVTFAKRGPAKAAKAVCTNAKICPSLPKPDGCKLCQAAVGAVGTASAGFDGAKIEAEWKDGCKLFPAGSADAQACVADIDTYFASLKKFLDALGGAGEAAKACTTAGFCPAFSPAWLEKEVCATCTGGFTTLIAVVKDSKVTKAAAEAELNTLCDGLAKLGPQAQAGCLAFVKNDFAKIWAAVDGTVTAAATCKELDACGAPSPPSPSPPSPAPGPTCVAKGVCLPDNGHRRDCCDGEETAKKDKHCKGKWKCG
jgi:hypothetical protein